MKAKRRMTNPYVAKLSIIKLVNKPSIIDTDIFLDFDSPIVRRLNRISLK